MPTYKITFDLSSPIILTHRLTLDGLLAYCWIQENMPEARTVGRLDMPEIIDFAGKIPLRKREDYFLGSFMFYRQDEGVKGTTRTRKRWEENHDWVVTFGKKQRKVDISRGEDKSVDMQFPTLDIPQCWFYADTDEPDELLRLLQTNLFGIGKKTSQGFGTIADIRIEPGDADFETEILRPTPVTGNWKPEVWTRIEYVAYKLPNWLPDNMAMCYVA